MLGLMTVHDLAYEDGRLIGDSKAFYGRDNAPIDAIWRRSVTRGTRYHRQLGGVAALNRSRECAQGGADWQLRGALGARQANLPGAVQARDQSASDRIEEKCVCGGHRAVHGVFER